MYYYVQDNMLLRLDRLTWGGNRLAIYVRNKIVLKHLKKFDMMSLCLEDVVD